MNNVRKSQMYTLGIETQLIRFLIIIIMTQFLWLTEHALVCQVTN